MAVITFQHGLFYPENKEITLSDVAKTLIDHEKIINLLPEFLEKSIDNISIEHVKISLNEIKIGSLSESFFVALFIIFQKDLEREVPDMIESITGMGIPDEYDTVVTVLALILLFYGAQYVISRVKKKSAEIAAPNIFGNYNTYINIASSKLGVPREKLEDALDETVKGNTKRYLARAEVDLFRPAKRGGDGRIIPRNMPPVSSETVAEFPAEAALTDLENDTVIENFTDVTLEVRATDLDKTKQGWAGFIHHEDFDSKKRFRFMLYPSVDAEALAECRRVKADIMVEYNQRDDDTFIPRCVHIISIQNDDPESV